jgi:uncharacterized glyoxalase superfamily protein PhnB
MTSQNIFPAIRYRDGDRALEWLKDAFGFEEKAVYRGEDGAVQHAELRLGDGVIMLGQNTAIAQQADARHSIYVTVADPDAHFGRAKAAGADITRELADQPYGSREYGAKDLEGNEWSFGTYSPHDD